MHAKKKSLQRQTKKKYKKAIYGVATYCSACCHTTLWLVNHFARLSRQGLWPIVFSSVRVFLRKNKLFLKQAAIVIKFLCFLDDSLRNVGILRLGPLLEELKMSFDENLPFPIVMVLLSRSSRRKSANNKNRTAKTYEKISN